MGEFFTRRVPPDGWNEHPSGEMSKFDHAGASKTGSTF